MNNKFKDWIRATKKDPESLASAKQFLQLLLLSDDENILNICSEIIVILNYLNSDDDTVSLALESSVAALIKLLSGGSDQNNSFDISNMRSIFSNKEQIQKELEKEEKFLIL